jgi:dihydroxyacetone kinase
MKLACLLYRKAIQASLNRYDLTSFASTCLSIAETIEQTAGGTSSAIYCIFLNAFAGGLLNQAPIAAAHHALMTLMSYTKARVGDRTLMDTLCPFIETLRSSNDLRLALQAAREGADRTCGLAAQLGRASYLSNEQVLESGIPDAGAYGLLELLNGMVNAISE